MSVPGRKPKPWALKVLEGGRGARKTERQGPPVKPPPRCGRPTATGTACLRPAGWGMDAELGPCKSHENLDRVGLAEPPGYLPDKAKELWRMLAPDLIATDRLRTEDLPLYEQMCMAYYFAGVARGTLIKEGVTVKDKAHKDTPRSHPAWRLWRDAVGVLRQFACEFGVTPSSRSRLELPAGAEDPQDPWSKF